MAEKTPLEKVEALFEEITASYHEGEKKEMRTAVKFLMVSLLHMKEQDPRGWHGLVEQYCIMLSNDPEKFMRVLESNRGHNKKQKSPDILGLLMKSHRH